MHAVVTVCCVSSAVGISGVGMMLDRAPAAGWLAGLADTPTAPNSVCLPPAFRRLSGGGLPTYSYLLLCPSHCVLVRVCARACVCCCCCCAPVQ